MPPKPSFHLGLASLLMSASLAGASEWRAGVSMGYGGAGLTTTESVLDAKATSTTTATVQRSEGPGMISIFVDRLLTDRLMLGAEHLRGFRPGPFTSGISFTGLDLRWFFMGPAPSVALFSEGGTLLVRRYTPYVGIMHGVAAGNISRSGELVTTSSGSGMYLGFKLGADYPIAPGWGLRPEINSSTTVMKSTSSAPTLTEFALQLGIYFYL